MSALKTNLLRRMSNTVSRFVADEDAATAAEYGVIAALIAAAIIVAVTALGNQLKTVFNTIGNKISVSS